jgi:fatty acid desaturase
VLLAIHAAAITAAVMVLPQLGRVYVGMAVGHAILSWYITCEHRGLGEEGSVLERTRSLRVPALVRWLLWNMPYHAEHHGWPAVPFHQLPALHAEVREHLVHCETPLYLYLHGGRERGGGRSKHSVS